MKPSDVAGSAEGEMGQSLEHLDDRRIQPRYTCRYRVRMLLPSGQLETTITRDLSESGLRVHTDNPIRPGTRVPLILTLFEPITRQRDEVYLLSVVVYCIHDCDEINFRLGLQAIEFAGDGEKKFTAAVDRLANPWAPLQYEDPALREHSFPLHRRVQLQFAEHPDLSVWTERVSHSTVAISLDKPYQDKMELNIGMPVVLPHTGVIKTINAKAMIAAIRLASGGNVSTTLKILDFDHNGRDLFHEELRQRFGIEPPEAPRPAKPASMLEPIGPWDRKQAANAPAKSQKGSTARKPESSGQSGANPDAAAAQGHPPESTEDDDDSVNLNWWR